MDSITGCRGDFRISKLDAFGVKGIGERIFSSMDEADFAVDQSIVTKTGVMTEPRKTANRKRRYAE